MSGADPMTMALSTDQGQRDRAWTFLTNHSHVLLALYRDPDLRQRDLSQLVGITEGAVQRILHDLEAGGYLDIERIGRRNHYIVHADLSLRHPLEDNHTIGELLERLAPINPTSNEAPLPIGTLVVHHRSSRIATMQRWHW